MATSQAVAGPSKEGSSSLPPLPPPPPIPFRKPGKSILKQPTPPAPKFFSLSTLSKLLPNQVPNSSNNPAIALSDDGKGIRGTPLKRAHFILPHLSTTYPISAANPPASHALKQEKADIEERERNRRSRLVRGNSFSSGSTSIQGDDYWSIEKVEQFYKECSLGRDEPVDARILSAIKAAGTLPRSLQLTDVQLDLHSATALSDLFTVEWGLRKLVLKSCSLDEFTLKPILHTLLITNSLSYLSLASNKQLKNSAWRLVGVYLSKALSLQFLDLSQNTLDRRAIEFIACALGTSIPSVSSSAPPSGTSTPTLESFDSRDTQGDKPRLVSLRMDECNLRPAALEALAHAIRISPLQHISLRNNRIAPPGAVALALMIKDYPDAVPYSNNGVSTATSPPSPSLSHTVPLTPLVNSPPINRSTGQPNAQVQHASTTYTPYIPRAKRGSFVSPAPSVPGSPITEERQVPIISTSLGGGITTRHPTPAQVVSAASVAARNAGPSAALLDKVRALDSLPRLGALKTLDLRNNDLRTGVSYISQVLKRNRTLKILNLSDNRIGVDGLVNIAEALKYNTTLETLDMSRNPCCGPDMNGITSLRTAFTLNTALKRLFLSGTCLTSAAAIMLAEFLPESSSLLHLDLTQNTLDMAGVMALSNGLKANEVMRCLDLNIPAGDEEMARLCREILNWCVRNTEKADLRARSEGALSRGRGIWGMIEDSALARDVRKGEGRLIEVDILITTRGLKMELGKIMEAKEQGDSFPPSAAASINRAKAILPALSASIEAATDPNTLEELLALNDSLTELIATIGPIKPSKLNLVMNGHTEKSSFPIPESLDDSDSSDLPGTNVEPVVGILTDSPLRIALLSPKFIKSATDENSPSTPKVDKGKGKALHSEPEGIDDEGEGGKIIPEPGLLSVVEETDILSPTDTRSRIWVEEEGEVFRKGVALLTPEKMEGELGDFAGEDLRIELLETEVQRPPARILDVDLDGDPILHPANEVPMTPPVPRSPRETR